MAPAPDLLESAEAAVARIAYLCSDQVISVQPSLKQKTPYSSQLDRLSSNFTPGIICGNPESLPEITVVRHNADPFLSAFEPLRSGQLVSILTVSTTLIPSIPLLHKLANYPLTIHVSLIPQSFPDYSDIAAVRQSGFTIIRSDSVQEAQDMAAVAHGVAVKSGRAVIHFFEADNSRDDPVPLEDRRVLDRMLDRAAARSYQGSSIDASNIYAGDGVQAQTRVNLPANGANGASNGVKSPPQSPTATTNGFTNGESASSNLSRTDSPASEAEVTYRPVNSADVYKYLTAGFEIVRQVTGRSYRPFEYYGPTYAENAIFLFGSNAKSIASTIASAASTEDYAKTGVIVARVYRPWTGQKFLDIVPKTVKKIAVLEQIKKRTTKWGPLFLDLLSTIRGGDVETKRDLALVGYQLGYISPSTLKLALRGILQNLKLEKSIQNLDIGLPEGPAKSAAGYELSRPEAESAYFKILNQLFGERLYIANALGMPTAGVATSIATSPEFGYGSLLARLEKKEKFQQRVEDAAKSTGFVTSVCNDWLARWLIAANDAKKRPQVADELITRLKNDGSALSSELLDDKSFFYNESNWLIGSDAWAYDLGNSGVHHVIASGKNINMLIIDSQPYSEKVVHDATRRKKDIGLYAMNFGGCYVASVAVYSSYTQVLHALIEAEQFNGPSVVLAYLPYKKEDESPLTMLQETKKAVDIGYWPLYRWDPTREENGKGDNFELDSERIRNEMKEFLDRENHLSRLLRRDPVFAANLKGSYGVEVRDAQKRKAKDAYAKLLEGLEGAPLTILFASDGGNAENLAKRLQRRGKARGLKAYAMSMDDYPIEDINSEENLVLITSVAGQGEFPQNGRNFWEAVKGGATDIDLAGVKYTVFGLGDSHYWPRKEDKIYYNKPAKDLDARLEVLGGKRIVDVGLGDDQDPDTYQTAYADWEPKLWVALGVDKVEGLADEPPPITNEDIKIASNFLRGTIVEGLEDMSTMAISAADQQLTKFHGTYMQDDRDLRDERKAQGLEPAYSFMIRCRLPGGIATPKQWLQMDDICEDYGNKTMKLTTRQTFQFHGIIKTNLRNSMRAINRALMTTIAACGDVNRNVMCSSLPYKSAYHRQVWEYSKLISDHLLPSTTAYHEIWLQDENDKKTQVAGDAVVDHEPLYGPTYLPRKFKITIAIPPHNDTDVYAHDIGLIAIKGEDGDLVGFNLLAGGGMGVTHNNKKTYPRTGSMFGYVAKEKVHLACEKIMLVQRDHGDRKNRKHARLKYTIDDMTVDVFRGKVEDLLGWKFEAERPFEFQSNIDTFGWQKDENGRNHFTFFIENGRIEDTPEFMMRTGLREIAKLGKGEFRLTGNQHLILSNVEEEDLAEVKGLMEHYGLDNVKFSGLRLSSSACVAFPTCGLAMAESERYLPKLIDKLESTLEEAGLRHDSIVMRMTGCPNGCARPWLAEVAFVGKAYGAYNMYLGGGYHGQRLNKLFRSSIKEDEILEILKPMFKRYAIEREDGEKFGDFCIRSGIIKETTHGTNFHEGVAEEDSEE